MDIVPAIQIDNHQQAIQPEKLDWKAIVASFPWTRFEVINTVNDIF